MTSSSSRRRGAAACFLGALCVAACSGSGGAPKVPLAQAATDSNAKALEAAHALIGPAAMAALDSGNQFFRKKEYAPALAAYRRASDLAPQHAAPLFGVYMVARATNNAALADSALAGIRARNGPLPTSPSGAGHPMSDSALKALHEQLKRGNKPG